MNIVLEELKGKLLEENLKDLFVQAYEQGVKDSQEQYAFPHLLNKKDLCKIFQVEEPTVNKIITRQGFPKSKFVTARYPRDEVFKWMRRNCVNVDENNHEVRSRSFG